MGSTGLAVDWILGMSEMEELRMIIQVFVLGSLGGVAWQFTETRSLGEKKKFGVVDIDDGFLTCHSG